MRRKQHEAKELVGGKPPLSSFKVWCSLHVRALFTYVLDFKLSDFDYFQGEEVAGSQQTGLTPWSGDNETKDHTNIRYAILGILVGMNKKRICAKF